MTPPLPPCSCVPSGETEFKRKAKDSDDSDGDDSDDAGKGGRNGSDSDDDDDDDDDSPFNSSPESRWGWCTLTVGRLGAEYVEGGEPATAALCEPPCT